MSILIKPYVLSVWEDTWDSSAGKFVEKRIGIIGTNEMIYQGRAIEPTLTRNVNGTKKLSFKMYKYFTDNMTGEKTYNKFSDWLVSERKVKLFYDNKWYDFIVKDVAENSVDYLFTYSLEDALVQELSKNGFGVTLDAQRMNNMGDVEYLATEVLKETDWNIESETFVERVDEALVYVQLPTNNESTDESIKNWWENVTIHKLTDNEESFLREGLKDSKVTDKSLFYGTTVLAFYSSCRNKPHRFQFIYLPRYDKNNVQIDRNRQILNKNCQYYIEFEPTEYEAKEDSYGFILPSGFEVIEKTYRDDKDDPSDSTISTWYRGGRYGFAQSAVYVPLLDRYCQAYSTENDDEGNPIVTHYGYEENEYNSPIFTTNLVSNTEFENTSGWVGTYTNDGTGNDRATIENVYGKFVTINEQKKFVTVTQVLTGEKNTGETLEEFLAGCSPYMKIELKSSKSLVINSGPYDNRTLIGKMPVGSKWAFRAMCVDEENETADLNFDFGNYVYNNGAYSIVNPEAEKDGEVVEQKITFSDLSDNNGHKIYEVTENTYVNENGFVKDGKLKIAISVEEGKEGVYYIKTLEFFAARFAKNAEGEDVLITLDQQGNNADSGVITSRYRYFKPSALDGVVDVKDLHYDCETDALSYDTYKPVYNAKGQKIRAVTAKESNYFNILQSIAETFECWLDLEIGRDDYGGIVSKTAKFKNYAGGDNYAAFRYGVNLKDIQRTYSSKNIVTKLMVKQNSNQHGKGGFCTVARAGANPSADTSIYDFSYFQNMGLMNATDYINTVYKIDGADGPDVYECLYSASENKPDLPVSFNQPDGEWHQEKQKDDKYVCSWKKTVFDEETTYDCVSAEAREIKDEYNLQGYFPRIAAINRNLINKSELAANLKAELLELEADLEIQKTKLSAAISGMEESAESFRTLTGVDPTELVGGEVSISTIELDAENKFGETAESELQTHIAYVADTDFSIGISSSVQKKTITITATATDSTKGFASSGPIYITAYPRITTGGGVKINKKLYINLQKETGEKVASQTLSVATDISSSQVQNYLNQYSTYLQQKTEANARILGSEEEQRPSLESQVNAKKSDYTDLETEINTLKDQKAQLNTLFFTKYSRFIQEGTWISEEHYDDEKYYNDALSVMYNSCYPQVAYTINTNEVSQLPGYELFNFEVGEKTYAEDGDFFGYDEKGYPKREEVIITEKTENLDDPSKNTNKVQNFKNQFQDLFQKITATVQQAQYSTGAYEKGVAEANAIAENSKMFLRNTLNGMAVNLSNPKVESISSDNSSVLMVADGKILIGTRNKDNEMDWKTGISSAGIAAELLTAGRIQTNKIQIFGGDSETFRWDEHGLTAFDCNTYNNIVSGVNTNKFVRFDKYGIYGIDGGKEGTSWIPGQTNGKTAQQEIDESATFALTWQGLKVTGNDGVEARIGKYDNYIINITKKTELGTDSLLSFNNSGTLQIGGWQV